MARDVGRAVLLGGRLHDRQLDRHREVVQQDREDRNVLAHRRLEVHPGHPDRGIAPDIEAELFGAGDLCAHRQAQAVAELGGLAPTDVAQRGGRVPERRHLVARAAGVVRGDGVVDADRLVNRRVQVAQHAVGIERRLVAVGLVRPVGAPFAVDSRDFGGDGVGASARAGDQLLDLGDDRLQHQRGIAHDALGDFDRVVEVLRVERGVDVVGLLGHRQAEAGLGERAADAEDDVGVLQELVDGLGEGAAAGAERERVRFGEGALALQRGGDGRFEQLGQLAQLIPGAGVVDALPGVDHRALGIDQRLRRLARVGRVGPEAHRRGRAVVNRLLDVLAPHVARHFEHDRALAPVARVSERPPHRVGQILGDGQLLRPLAHVLEVDQPAEVGRDVGLRAGVAAGDRDQRRGLAPGLRQPAERVLRAGAVLGQIDADLVAGVHPREGVGHVDRGALLAHDDGADVGFGGGLEDRIDRVADDEFDALALDHLGDCVGDFHAGVLSGARGALGALGSALL